MDRDFKAQAAHPLQTKSEYPGIVHSIGFTEGQSHTRKHTLLNFYPWNMRMFKGQCTEKNLDTPIPANFPYLIRTVPIFFDRRSKKQKKKQKKRERGFTMCPCFC